MTLFTDFALSLLPHIQVGGNCLFRTLKKLII